MAVGHSPHDARYSRPCPHPEISCKHEMYRTGCAIDRATGTRDPVVLRRLGARGPRPVRIPLLARWSGTAGQPGAAQRIRYGASVLLAATLRRAATARPAAFGKIV